MQEAAETAIARGLTALHQQLGFKPYQQATLPQRRDYVQAALMCLSPTGSVEAIDAWLTGFTPDMVARAWIGFDDRRDRRLVDLQGR